jgi:protein involved in plasmid replication-relaxation
MDVAVVEKQTRRPRFRRASEPPAFRLTDDDVEIVRQIARHRFIGSGEIAALVNRSIDRTNDRLMRLFHAGYLDRPRAQLDRFPTGSGRIIYALADRGARLLSASSELSDAHLEWSRKNREAGRPFIEHQVKIVEFRVALERAVRARGDVRVIDAEEILSSAPEATQRARRPFVLRARLSDHGITREISAIPDLVFGLRYADGSRRCFMVEIDRGTMPITRADLDQTSFERKMRVYLAAHAARQHERQFGWKNFRVLTMTSDRQRMASIAEALRQVRAPNGPGPSLFLFNTLEEIGGGNPLMHSWRDGNGRTINLV